MPVLFDGRRPGLIPGTDPGAPPDLSSNPDDEAQAGITAQAVSPLQKSNTAPDPYDTDPLIAFARSLPNGEDPLLAAYDAPPPENPNTVNQGTGVKQPGVFEKIRNTFTDEGAGYDLGGLSDVGGAIKDTSFAAAQGLAGSFNSLTRNVMEGIGKGAVPAFADKIANALSDHPSNPVRTWWWQHMVDPLVANQTEFDLGQNASTGDKVAHALGGTLAMISQAVISGGEGEAPEALASTADVVRGAVQHGVQSMSVPALSDAVDVGRNVLQKTGDQTKAIEAAQVSYLTSVAGGIIPIAKPGGILTRAATGAASGAVTGELARTSQNALLPEDMQTPFSTEDALISAGMGGVMGAVMGPRLPDLQRVGAAIDKAAADAEHAQNATFQAAMATPPGHLEAMPRYQELYDSATASTPEEKADYARQTLANELGQAEALKATAAALQPSLEMPPLPEVATKAPPPPDQGAGVLPDAAAQAGKVGFGAMAQEARGAGVDPKMIAGITQGVLRKEVPPQEGIRMLQQAIAVLPSKEVRPTTEPPAASGGSTPESAIPVPAEAAQEGSVGTVPPAEAPAVGAGAVGRAEVDAEGRGPAAPTAAPEVAPVQPGSVAPTGGVGGDAEVAPKPATAVGRVGPRRVAGGDASKDSALEFIAKQGGISIDQGASEDMKAHRVGIRRAFNKKGMTLESAGEALSQAGWQVTDANGAVDKTKVLDLLSRELGGQKQYSTARSDEELRAAHQSHEDLHQAAAAEATPDTQEHADHEEHAVDFAALRLQAEQHATSDEVESAMEAQDDVEAERRLKALIARGESSGARSEPQADVAGEVGQSEVPLERTRAPSKENPHAKAGDLFGEDVSKQQALADEVRRRDEGRSPNKDVSIETGRPDDLFSQSRQQTDLVDAARAPKTTTFETAKGSKYVVDEQGRTTRDKAARAEHPGESGPQPKSEATYYVTPEDAQKLGEFQVQGGGRRSVEPTSDGRIGVKYLDGKDAGKFERRTVVQTHTKPAKGLTPVETWKGGRKVHFGNEITQVDEEPGGPAEARANPAKPTSRDRRLAKLRDAYTPGNIVKGYGGKFDRVIAFHEPKADNEPWSVTVREVVKKDGQWVTDPQYGQERTHSTNPGPNAVVERAPTPEGGEPKQLLSRGESGTSEGGASKDTVRGWLDAATRSVAGAADVHIVEDIGELQDELGLEVPLNEDTRGVYIVGGKEVYIVANRMADQADAEQTFTHEVFGHLAMERYADMQKVVQSVQKLHDMGSRSVGKLWDEVTQNYPELDDETHAKEVIALMAERGVKNAIMDRMFAAARGLLRKMGIKLDYSEGELRQLIASSARALREDSQRISPADSVHAHDADLAYRAGDDQALGEALGKMSIAHSQLDALPDANESAHEQQALDDVTADELVGTKPPAPAGAEPEALYSRKVKEDPDITAIRRRIMANAVNENLPFKDRLRNVLQRWTNLSGLAIRQGFIDGFASIAAYEKLLNEGKLLDASVSPYKQTLATQNLPSVMTAIVKSGVPVYRYGAYVAAPEGRTGLLHIFAPLVNHKDGNLLPQWELYAAARRASRLIDEQNPDGSSREKLFTRPDIAKSMALGRKYPEFEKAFDQYQEFNKQVLDLAQDAGLINPESRAIWEKNDYVPFYRANEEISGTVNPVSMQRAIANQRSKIVTLKGGAQPLEDVFESMLMNTAHLVDASFKNRAAQMMVQMFDGVATTPVNLDANPVRIDIGQVRRALDSAGITLAEKLTPEQNKEWLTFFQRVKPAADNVISVMYDGKPKYYEVHDPLLLQSITQMGPNESLKWLDLLGFTGAKRILTRTATALPAFMVRNFIRDTQSAWVQNPVGLKPFISAAKGFSDYLVDKPIVRDLMLAGAGGDAIYDNQPGNIKKILTREMKAEAADSFLKTVASPRRLWEMYTKLQQASENANRIAVYKGARAQGLSHAEAAYRAHDVLNFQQRGAYPGVQFLTRVVPFLNARVQGLDRLWRAFKEDRNGFLLKGAMMAAFTGVTMLLGDKDPRYQELEEWDRDAYWHIFVGDQHWRIPKGFEVGALFGTLPERAIRLMRSQDTGTATAQSLMNLIGNTFAFNPIPQLARPAVEDVTNYDFFTGRPIINDQQKEQIAPLQAQPNTSPTLQALAGMEPQWMPDSLRSPLRLEHWIRGYTSSVGMLGLTVADRLTRASGGYPDAPSKPWYEQYVPATPVTTSSPHNTKWTNQLYTMAAEADASAKALRSYASQGRYDELRSQAKQDGEKLALRPALDKMVREFGALNRQSKMILQSRMDPDKKQAMLDKINTERADLARQLAPYAGAF